MLDDAKIIMKSRINVNLTPSLRDVSCYGRYYITLQNV